MTTYTFDTDVGVTPSGQTWSLVTNTKTYVSPLTNAVQTATRKGSHWKTTATFNNLTGADRAKMQAFLSKLNGQENRIYFQDYSYSRRGTAPSGDTGLRVDGGSQTGTSVLLDGATASTSDYFRAGDRIAFDNCYHMVTADCDSNPSGHVTVPIAPALRGSPANNALVNFTTPLAVMIVTSAANWDSRIGGLSSFTIEAIEDVLA